MRLLAWNGRSCKLNILFYRVPTSITLRTYKASPFHVKRGPQNTQSALGTGRLYPRAEIRGKMSSLLVYQHNIMFSHLQQGGFDMPDRSNNLQLGPSI